MPPKAKAKADAKKENDQSRPAMEVPPPPPTPVCIALPESLAVRYNNERCLLLAWADAVKNNFKVQIRPYVPGEPLDKVAVFDPRKENEWKDAKEIERIRMPGRGFHEARLYAFNEVRLLYRLVQAAGPKEIDGLYVANWQSAISEPVACYIDPPTGLQAELSYDCDTMPAIVKLKWKSSNMESLRSNLSDAGTARDPTGQLCFDALPGLLPVKVQVRWRVMRTLGSIDDTLPKDLAAGRYYVSPAIDNITHDATYDAREETWSFPYKEALHGVVTVFSVRAGTSYRWSPWSEDSNELEVEVPEPCPRDVSHLHCRQIYEKVGEKVEGLNQDQLTSECVEIREIRHHECEASWVPFTAQGFLAWVEYRITICMIKCPEAVPAWETEGVTVGNFAVKKPTDEVTAPIRGLRPNTWYRLQVDARYPNVGKRAFSVSKALSAPFFTPFPERPPLPPLPVRLDAISDVEEKQPAVFDHQVEEEDRIQPSADLLTEHVDRPEDFNWASRPWVALKVELPFWKKTYDIEYKAAAVGGCELGGEHYEGWQRPLCIQHMTEDILPCGEHWLIIRIGLPEGAPEVVVCRLVHRDRSPQISPLQWSIDSPPVVSQIASPEVIDFLDPLGWGRIVKCLLVPSAAGGVRLLLRFLLRPGSVEMDSHLASAAGTPSSAWKAPLVGHRFVTHCQLRLRHREFESSSLGWQTLPPRLLPQMKLPYKAVALHPDGPGDLKNKSEVALANMIGWAGNRYDLEVDLNEHMLQQFLLAGKTFEGAIRVGNESRWSCWATWSVDNPLSLPVPRPFHESLCFCSVQSPTRVKVRWPCFDRMPGIISLEYIIRAGPIFDQKITEGGNSQEGPSLIERIFLLPHTAKKTDDELLETKEVQRLMDSNFPMSRIATGLKDLRAAEFDAEKDLLLQVELSGLLPATRYAVSVTARYPSCTNLAMAYSTDSEDKSEITACVEAMLGPTLHTQVDMPGGETAPAAPREAGLSDLDESGDDDIEEGRKLKVDLSNSRTVLLVIEDRPGYCLEYCACEKGLTYFDYEGKDGLRNFSGSWPETVKEVGSWQRVLSTRRLRAQGGTLDPAREALVAAVLPNFSAPVTTGNRQMIPDVVRFRLCTIDRGATHPCRWVGGISEPMAVSFAPPRRAPRLSRVLSDDRWCMTLSFETFKVEQPPVPPRLLGGQDYEEDSEEEEQAEQELVEFRRQYGLPPPPAEDWACSELSYVPVGYGHKMVTSVDIRFSLQSGMSAMMRRQLESKELDPEWQSMGVLPIHEQQSNGRSRYTLEVGSPTGLLDGGIYVFQVRVGDGRNWSAWSHTSKAFLFQVPPPVVPMLQAMSNRANIVPAVSVEVVSSTAARVRWADCRPAPGLTVLEYEVKATPQQNSRSHQAGVAIAKVFEHRYRGGFIEYEIANLLPFTPYVFSVQARYPRVGTREWSSLQESEVVTLEQAAAFQDPPVPAAVPELEEKDDNIASVEATIDGMCTALLSFPGDEDGANYDLEYAHVLGGETDTAEMRTSQSIWHTPVEVSLLESPAGGASLQSCWRVQLPDIRSFRAEPLKLALLQRVVFRLRARRAPEGPSSRWWSSLSAPVSTGFAAPETATASLLALGGRLAVEVAFSLDFRIAEAADSAGTAGLRLQRADLFKAIQMQRNGAERSKSYTAAGLTPARSSVGTVVFAANASAAVATPSWPRGFGHAFASRYQLRVRYLTDKQQWSPWEVYPDAALPKEALNAGLVNNSSTERWFQIEAPQPKRSLNMGEFVQVAVRVGDGTKWSSWKQTKEVTVTLMYPRPAREGDLATASWIGPVCTVSWPLVAAHSGIDLIEYQLKVVPDSSYLLPYVGGVVIGPSSTAIQKAYASATVLAGQAKLVETGIGPEGMMTTIALELRDLCPYVRHSFAVLARYPAVGSRSFTQVYEVRLVSWKPLGATSSPRDARVITPGIKSPTLRDLDAPGKPTADMQPPAPSQVPLSPDAENKMKRWVQDGEGRLVLLTWPGLELKVDGVTAAKTYEVQITEFTGEVSFGMEDSTEWRPCAVSADPFLVDSVPCIALRNLPFLIGQFRLFDPWLMCSGPPTSPLVTVYEPVEPEPKVEMTALGKGAPRTLGVQVTIPRCAPGGTQSRATRYQIRFRAIRPHNGSNLSWEELQPELLLMAGGNRHFSIEGRGPFSPSRSSRSTKLPDTEVIVREEDGLELGPAYEFQARFGDDCRLGPWSKSSRALRFSVSPPVATQGSGLRVAAKSDSAALSWSAFEPDETLSARMPGFKELPIEYLLSITGGAHKEPVASFVTRQTHVTVMGLKAHTAYSACLQARWCRFGSLDDEVSDRSTLLAAFITEGTGGRQMVAELSVRVPCERLDGYGPLQPLTVKLPITADGMEPTAVTLDLDPFYVQPKLQHYTPGFVCKPSQPSSKAGAEEQTSSLVHSALLDEGLQLAASGKPKLPSIVPMPPPKFTTRDPLTFALIPPSSPAKPVTPRPSTTRRHLPGA